jgi:voltage-gated potassium channel
MARVAIPVKIDPIRKITDTFTELFVITTIVLIAAATAYSFLEHESWGRSLWWAVVTAGTVGYGDEYPVTMAGQIVGGLLIAFCVLFLVPMITARIASHLIVNNDAWSHHEQEQLKADVADIKQMVETLAGETKR